MVRKAAINADWFERRCVRLARDQPARDFRQEEGAPSAQEGEHRTPGRRDRDRVYYSGAFRRLAGVTQVLTPDPEGFLTHNRLTHSLKVAQVARSIADRLLADPNNHALIIERGGLDADVTEAAALAHDIGHPPFGHIGERVLDRYAIKRLKLRDGFEGNAQTFRILTRLEPKSLSRVGLDLTRATRAAVLKYPWLRADQNIQHGTEQAGDPLHELKWKKFGAFDADRESFEDARTIVPNREDEAQSLEAAVMDVADDITYAIHDLEDFHAAGFLAVAEARESLEHWVKTHSSDKSDEQRSNSNKFGQLREKLKKNYASLFDHNRFAHAIQVVAGHLQFLLSDSVGYHRSIANTRIIMSRLITEYVEKIYLRADTPSIVLSPIALNADHWHQIQIMKEITRKFIIERPEVAAIQQGQQRLLWQLVELVVEWRNDPDEGRRLPRELQEGLAYCGDRAIIDYVAGLSDHHAIALHRTLTGGGPSLLSAKFVS
jgi:dGTPase